MVDIPYWNQYYKKGEAPSDGSTFAVSILAKVDKEHELVELGCGNGRDANFFAKNGIKVFAVDIASEAINQRSARHPDNPTFVCADFTNMAESCPASILDMKFGSIYSRFTLHAVRAESASKSLNWSYSALRSGGILFIEVRSVKDKMCGKGTPVEGEKDAWIYTHYRRFHRKDDLISELENIGFTIDYILESDGLAVYKDDDPVVIRVHARKP